MQMLISWALAAAALYVGWATYGGQGVLAAVTVIVFWLLLHFNRAMRAMSNATRRPIGSIASAVMLNAKLHPGMTMMQVLTLTRSLGERVQASPEVWAWSDEGGSRVAVEMSNGRVTQWTMTRPESVADDAPGPDATP